MKRGERGEKKETRRGKKDVGKKGGAGSVENGETEGLYVQLLARGRAEAKSLGTLIATTWGVDNEKERFTREDHQRRENDKNNWRKAFTIRSNPRKRSPPCRRPEETISKGIAV